ncbi:MAG: hypothetical protein FWF95_01105 [Syntrophorhabdaceae bacterium]|nr:hypothetical protein [Syntrophorhabdaceae bacterium]
MMKDFFEAKSFHRIALVAAVVLVLGLAACGGGGDESNNNACVSGGSGASESAPYIICTAKDLADLADRVNTGTESSDMYYQLGRNIDLSAYKSSKGWIPIGITYWFTGNFDGNGKTVTNLFIDDDSSIDPAGLFGRIDDGGTVKNLGIEGADITGGSLYVGGVAGRVGVGSSGSVSNCYVTGKVSGEQTVGGVAGHVGSGGSVSDCYVTGKVSGEQIVGGVVGNVGSGGSVINCYATGKVSGENFVGGVAGSVVYGGSVTGCAALNPEIERNSGANTTFGRVAGSTSTLVNNVALSDMTPPGGIVFAGTASNKDGANITKGEAKTQTTYSGAPRNWAFSGGDPKWKWGGASYPLPVLYWQTGAQIPAALPDHLLP